MAVRRRIDVEHRGGVTHSRVEPVVSIPVYKPFSALASTEVVSYARALQTLRRYPIWLFGPAGLSVEGYLAEASRNSCDARYVEFSDGYFRDLESYSRLMLSVDFYRAHERFSHMLLYQLDAYVFSDELESWCR